MGVVLNPVGYRIGYFISWSDAWYVHRINYSAFLHNMLYLKSLIYFILYLYFPRKFSYWVYSHLSISLFRNKLFLNIYIYNAFTRDVIYDTAFWMRWGKFRKIRFPTFWLKKQLIDYNRMAQRWFIIMQCLNIPISKLTFDHVKYRYRYYKGRKIKRLKMKHYLNKRDWYAREEIVLLKRMLFLMKKGYNKFGSKFLKFYYEKWYYKIFKFKITKKSKNFLLKIIQNNYKFLFYIISFFDFSLKCINLSYPKRLFKSKDMRFFLNIYIYWFLHRPIFFQFSKFVELLIVKFDKNLNFKLKFFMLDNTSINASFLARYVGTALKLKFSFKDVMVPIKKKFKKIDVYKKI